MGGLFKFLGGTFLGILNTIFSVFTGGFKGAMSLVQSAVSGALQYHQESIEFARTLGMSLEQSQAYASVLTDRAADLGFKYGVAAEAVKELQRNLSDATGKAIMLNDVDTEKFLQMNKLVGAGVTNQFTDEIMNHLGGQLHTVEGAVSKAYATAAKSGLNAAKFSDKVAKNLSMANKLSFRDGVNGIIKMTALSEKLGFNLKSVEQAAGNFMEIDQAIENSARLQMLGGAASAYGGNPLEMAFEANYDPEAFTERMTNMLKGLGTFDAKTGMASVNGMNMNFAREIAKALGISADEAVGIAKKQAEIQYKESSGLANMVRGMNLSDEQKDFLINTSYVGKDGSLKMTDRNGKERDVTSFTAEEIEEKMKLANMSSEDLLREQAMSLTSIQERVQGFQTTEEALLAKSIEPHLQDIQNKILTFGGYIIEKTRELVPKISQAIGSVLRVIEKYGGVIKTVINGVGNILGFIFDNFKYFLMIYAGAKILGLLTNLGGIFRGGFNLLKGGGKAVNAGARTARAAATGTGKRIGLRTKFADMRAGYQLNRGAGSGRISSVFKGIRDSGHLSPKNLRLAKLGGAGAAAVGVSAIMGGIGMNEYKKNKKELDEQLSSGAISKEDYDAQMKQATNDKNASIGAMIGGTLGTVLGGPIGGVIGNALGSFAGENLTKATDFIKDTWNGPVRKFAEGVFGSAGAGIVDGVGNVVGGLANGVGNVIEGAASAVGEVAAGAWDGIKTAGKGVMDGFGKMLKGDVVGGLTTMLSGVVSSVGNLAKGIWKGIGSLAEGIWKGIGSVAEGIWKGIGNFAEGVWKGLTSPFKSLSTIIEEEKKKRLQGLEETMKSNTLLGQSLKKTFESVFPTVKAKASEFLNRINSRVNPSGNTADRDRVAPNVASNAIGRITSSVTANTANGNATQTQRASGGSDYFGQLITENNNKQSYINDILTKTSNVNNALSVVSSHVQTIEGDSPRFSQGGIVGGDLYEGDQILARVNSEEMVLNKNQQMELFKSIGSMGSLFGSAANSMTTQTKALASGLWNGMSNIVSGVFDTVTSTINGIYTTVSGLVGLTNNVKAKPIGEREYIYEQNNNINENGVRELTVKDINVNINGTIKLDGGNIIKNIDINQLLNDTTFMSSLKDIIKASINNDMNGGRFMNDNATLRGSVSTTTYWGR